MYPAFLRSDPDKTFLPKINYFLHEKGLSEAETCTVVTKHPHLLTISLGKKWIPICNYLEDIIGPVELRKLIKCGSWVFSRDPESTVIPNTELLKELGVPNPCLKLIFSNRPEIFGLKHDKFKDIAGEVKQMGFNVSKTVFVLAMNARSFKGQSLWNKCCETYRRWGWSEDDIYMAFRKHPNCMIMSEKKISLVLDFVVNELGRESRSIAQCPHIMFYNLGKRIAPRCSVVQMLCSKGLIKKNWSLSSVLGPSENRFLGRFVMRYVEKIPQLYDLYKVKAGVVVEA